MTEENKDITQNGWESWGKYVLKTLEKLEDKVNTLEDRINENNLESKTDLVELKTKAGIVAAIAGIIASGITSLIVALFMYYITHKQPTMDLPKTQKSYIEHVIKTTTV